MNVLLVVADWRKLATDDNMVIVVLNSLLTILPIKIFDQDFIEIYEALASEFL